MSSATCCRCWRVLRSWTTACCWVCTSWTRARERGASRARQGGTGGDPWVSGCSTPPPWSPSRETARPPRPSPRTTREWSGAGRKQAYYAHIFGHTHSASVRLLISTFSPADTVTQSRSYLTQQHTHTAHTAGLSHNHSYTNTNTATVPHVHGNTHECKYCKCLFHKHL